MPKRFIRQAVCSFPVAASLCDVRWKARPIVQTWEPATGRLLQKSFFGLELSQFSDRALCVAAQRRVAEV